jgi:cyclopropane fatty-acyl-phospholipid synthase-like methyltransferase
MVLSENEKIGLFNNPKYPRSMKYDYKWVLENQMGSNCLWLAESIMDKMNPQEDDRVLDFGCGKAISSIFMAKEYGVRVVAADYWIDPTDNMKRIREMNLEDRIFPLKVEAHQLPFADESFDTILSINSFQFYATSEYYLKNNIGKALKKEAV